MQICLPLKQEHKTHRLHSQHSDSAKNQPILPDSLAILLTSLPFSQHTMSPPLTCCCGLLAAATTRAVPCSTPALSAAGLEVLELSEHRQDALVVRLGLESTNASLPPRRARTHSRRTRKASSSIKKHEKQAMIDRCAASMRDWRHHIIAVRRRGLDQPLRHPVPSPCLSTIKAKAWLGRHRHRPSNRKQRTTPQASPERQKTPF